MTREEAIRLLGFLGENWHGLYLQALDMAIAALREQPRWISVEERLPEATGKYIVCTEKKSVYCAKFYKYISERYPEGYFGTDSYTHTTHWMPLPEPPEVEV